MAHAQLAGKRFRLSWWNNRGLLNGILSDWSRGRKSKPKMYKFDQNLWTVRAKKQGCGIFLSILSALFVELSLNNNVESRQAVSALNRTLNGNGWQLITAWGGFYPSYRPYTVSAQQGSLA
jgi:hypothetical protein